MVGYFFFKVIMKVHWNRHFKIVRDPSRLIPQSKFSRVFICVYIHFASVFILLLRHYQRRMQHRANCTMCMLRLWRWFIRVLLYIYFHTFRSVKLLNCNAIIIVVLIIQYDISNYHYVYYFCRLLVIMNNYYNLLYYIFRRYQL